ncbi:MAG: DHH family phosphoesterase [Planctomycetota bacterium]|jgi:phosphoesterase RecJ-like protein
MSDYESTATVDQVARRINDARNLLLTTHVKPDGDGVGSALALSRALRARGVEPEIYLMGPLESRLRDIAGDTPYHLAGGKPPQGEHDLVVVLDTGAWTQLEPIADWLRERRDRIVGIDHHAKGDDVAPMRIVDATAAATTQVLLPVLQAMGCEITGGPESVAEALFVGLATDTGWFRFPSAGAEALHLAAWLLTRGVDKPRLYQVIEETFRPQRLALQARALASLEYALDGAAVIMTLRPDDFRETGGTMQDVSELVNTPMAVRTIRISILLAQTSAKGTKFSFRSKPDVTGLNNGATIDMNALAQRFGGGGHVHAAGAHVQMDADRAKAALRAALEETANANV